MNKAVTLAALLGSTIMLASCLVITNDDSPHVIKRMAPMMEGPKLVLANGFRVTPPMSRSEALQLLRSNGFEIMSSSSARVVAHKTFSPPVVVDSDLGGGQVTVSGEHVAYDFDQDGTRVSIKLD